MAGMLAGVESARRRRIHQSIVWSLASSSSSSWLSSSCSTNSSAGCGLCPRRSTFSSSTTHSSPSSLLTRNTAYQVDEKLGQLAREAKERLDERLRLKVHDKSHVTIRNNREGRDDNGNRREARHEREVVIMRSEDEEARESNRREVKKKKKKGWAAILNARGRISKPWEQDQADCAICLEEFSGEQEEVVNLPCAHRFHRQCLQPWLQSHSLCPCCRMSIL